MKVVHGKKPCLAAIVFFIFTLMSGAGFHLSIKAEAAMIGKQAPEWVVSDWVNTDGFKLSELRGKVVVINFFQLWCPGCSRFSLPLLKKWEEKYHGRDDIQLLGIHTVFEGHSYQTPQKLKQYLKEKNITYPIGIDDYVSSEKVPETMIRYQTRGTPEIAIIDKQGKKCFQRFGGFEPEIAEKLIHKLLSGSE